MLEKLRACNPDKVILDVNDPAFAEYGMVFPDVALPEMKHFLYSVERTGVEHYVACSEELMQMQEADLFKDVFFGQVPCQVGWYYNYGTKLNAVEYHKCSEILYEYEPCVITIAKLWDIENGTLDTGKMKCFYVPPETCVELYGTTLHFAPARACKQPVMQIVAQSLGTNTPLPRKTPGSTFEHPWLLQRNKWVLAHPEAAASIDPDVYVGLTGENITIQPVED